MLLFWRAKLVLLAVPKTGTTALEEAFLPHADAAIVNPPGKKHITARRWESDLAPYFENGGNRRLKTMAVIREPRDWLASWYRYRTRPETHGSPTSTAGMAFADFVEAWLAETPPAFAHIGRQSRFVSSNEGRMIVDHLFRYEDMARVVQFLEDRLGVHVDVPRRNTSPPGDMSLPAALEDRLRREAQADFALWDRLGR